MTDQPSLVVVPGVEGDHIKPAQEPKRADSPESISDKEMESFEDALDSSSTRSLTNRKQAFQSLSPTFETQPSEENKHHPLEVSVDELPKSDSSQPSSETDTRRATRLSAGSGGSLDNVALDEDASTAPKSSANSVSTNADQTGSDTKSQPSNKNLSLSSFKGALPSMPSLPWSPGERPKEEVKENDTPLPPAPPPPPAPEKPSNPPPVQRKLTSPFSWLSRGSMVNKDSVTPQPAASQPSPRRNTASSVATIVSNPEMMLKKLEEEGGTKSNESRNSLKDRFKFVRMREEKGQPEGEEEDNAGSGSAGLGAGADIHGMSVATPTSPLPLSPDRALAPGTAAGISAGPSSINDTAVDWDLWQRVVYEGPAAVARTSADDLNKAIATGIPNAIRGVIWQVLAQSKNEGLEIVYRELVARGTDKDKGRNSTTVSVSSGSNYHLGGKDVITSSSSSVHSAQSGPNGTSSPAEKDGEAIAKAQVATAAEMKKKEKEDAAMISKLERIIKRDLGARTSYSKFAAANGLQDGLFGVCKAYALFDEAVSYAQGMNFIIMPLLFNMPEEEAFCLLVRLMNHYELREMFVAEMPGLHKHLYQFERLLEDFEPALYCHLHRRGISPHLYATQWFLTLFAYRFPLQLVLRIYDLILSEGLSAILKFGIVLMQKNAQTLLSMSDMMALTNFLKDKLFDVYIDNNPSTGSILENGFFGNSSSAMDKEIYRADQLVKDACEVKITPEVLESYAQEWKEKTAAEKAREIELEQLKASNQSLTHRVRSLESRIETVDKEQTSLATELVHYKVENEELKDENEGLKGQVHELRLVIEKQPEEIEQAWQQERDDLMKRNERVHEENQKLEKEMAELEEELVQTKMKYAEITSQHENLSRKWADLRKRMEDS